MIEDTIQSVQYVRCTVCQGSRVVGTDRHRCDECDGWGMRVTPVSFDERMSLGLQAMSGASFEVARTPVRPSIKRRLRLPLRKKPPTPT
jgi:hypothetical protein